MARSLFRALVAGLAFALVGCAGATTAPRVVLPLAYDKAAPVRISEVVLDVKSGIWITNFNRQDILSQIRLELTKRMLMVEPGAAASSTPPQVFSMHVLLTRFDEGNEIARLALMGLGQIHIEGTVTLINPAGQKAGEYAIKKTFAGGGIFGAVTTTEDVENGFAKSVAAGLLPADDKKPGKDEHKS